MNIPSDFSRSKAIEVVDSVLGDYYSPIMSEAVSVELSKLKDFFDFSKEYGCFIDERFVDKKTLSFGKYFLNVNMINSCMFSTIDGADTDIGLHFIQSYEINKLSSCCDIPSITVMHHPIEWFHEIARGNLNKEILDNSNFLLLGHRHTAEAGSFCRGSNDRTLILNGGALNKQNNSESDYYAFEIDFDSGSYELFSFEWDRSTDRYIQSKKISEPIVYKKTHFIKGFTQQFARDFFKDDLLYDFVPSIHTLFTFPDLRVQNPSSERTLIKNMDEFLLELSEKNIIHIQGRSSSGKTTLAKKIFEELSNSKIVLFLDANFRVKDKSLENKIKSLVSEQFGDDNSVKLFEQEPKSNKVLIIDNYHKVKSDRYWLTYLTSKFSKVILVSATENKVDIMKAIDFSLMSELNISNMEILPFLKRKRSILIAKTCLHIYESLSIDAYRDHQKISEYISNQLKAFSFSPYLVVMYTRNYGVPGAFGKSPTKVFSHVFEANIVQKLSHLSSSTVEPDQAIWLLSQVAYYSYTKKRYPLKQSEITSVIESFEAEYGNKVSVNDFLNTALDSRILVEVDANLFGFTASTYYSYFVAKELKRMYIEGQFHVINEIFENLLVSINSEIILFFTFLLENNNIILEQILNRAVTFMQDWSELSFIPCNIAFFKELDKNRIFVIPDKKIKDDHLDVIEKSEEESSSRSADFQFVHNDIFQPEVTKDENEYLYEFLTGLKHIYLISTILPDFFFAMRRDLKNRFTQNIYSLPNRLLYHMFASLDSTFAQDYGAMLSGLGERYPHMSENELVDRLKTFLHSLSETLILKIYQVATQGVITNESMDWFLDKGDPKKITNKMMMALAASYTDKDEIFAPYLISIMDLSENKVIANVARSVSYEYFLRESSRSMKSHIMALHNKTFSLSGNIKKLPER